MLKLPKGLKKKKKGKKSKKNQELFTEEELENYKREQREKQLAEEEKSEPKPADDEWSKFNALTTGIDTVLKKTQGDLDRIKESSYFQRVAPKRPESKPNQKRSEATEKGSDEKDIPKEEDKKEEEEEEVDNLAQAVIELSESEEESEEADDIFDTNYIDAIASGEVQLAYVPESPTELFDEGPDPFDTSYADTFVKETTVSKRGKKLVNIGVAVEVLTGRVEKVPTVGIPRPHHRGPQNLLLENFDEAAVIVSEQPQEESVPVVKSLLDDPADDIPDVPIDLSVSLHLALQKEQKEQKSEEKTSTEGEKKVEDIVSEFDVLNVEDDEFAELAAESLTKKDDVRRLSNTPQVNPVAKEVFDDWSAFEGQKDKKPDADAGDLDLDNLSGDFDITADDPFNTTFVEKIIPPALEEDDDFDPRAEESNLPDQESSTFVADNKPAPEPEPIPTRDFLTSNNEDDIPELSHAPIVPTDSIDQSQDIDPFDTSAVVSLVQPKATEIKFLEQELLQDTCALNDPDFDPRADESKPEIQIAIDYQSLARRKSSLSLNIGNSTTSSQKSVVFIEPTDLLGANSTGTGGGKIQKPLTPYYSDNLAEVKEIEDPFDTSFVSNTNPSQVELSLLEKNLLNDSQLSRSISDQDFNPRADSPVVEKPKVNSDLLAVDEEHNIKVLTPAVDRTDSVPEIDFVDPFDTSAVDHNILPGKTELKLLESEFLVTNTLAAKHTTAVLDTYTDSEELGLGHKVLTPNLPKQDSDFTEDVDPFDTSIANNIAPGQAEIKILESEFMNQ